ncbi:SWI/SNF and RSC complex subunit Arp9 [Schizosaccharomyces japonicus yFS275]|uniref:SWI/SNF and RSC complex subunit Arp9 n=1 Tax=Schizosaccharomyces japonicus (strain yFS275 / FY16936) TaxID=402676 RepID=B6K1E3_SCHJY|nr:SWI/SNF and RSC complex subunit Arp9 [Schizosaccharomyces japonicus yFS275]EEB07764.1 SWI/SNF and RSC complex subunit Arp9 [Schizosaccharomyces japonicus yFS275]
MPSFRDDHIIVIQVGSLYHKAVFGLAESLSPPKVHVRTRVGIKDNNEGYVFDEIHAVAPKPKNNEELDGVAANEKEKEDNEPSFPAYKSDCIIDDWKPLPNEVCPILRGRVVRWDILRVYWKNLYDQLVAKFATQNDPNVRYPVCLVVPTYWSRRDREFACQTFFEDIRAAAFAIAEEPLMGLYAVGILSGLVIDVGYEKTDITPVIDGQIVSSASQQVQIGGRHMTLHLMDSLKSSLPTLQSNGQYIPAEQVTELFAEQVKCSAITQVLRESPNEPGTYKDIEPEHQYEDEGVEDIGKIVASGQTRAYLAQKEREKKGLLPKHERPANADVEFQKISVAPLGECIIGRERFDTCKSVFHRSSTVGINLAEAIYMTIKGYAIEYEKQNELWENIVIVGCGSRIRGFREGLIQQLQFKYRLVGKVDPYYVAQGTDPIMGMTTSPLTPYPTLINPSKTLPDYFPAWKQDSTSRQPLEELPFLGGSIIAKTVFNDSVATYYVTTDDYTQVGPVAIHRK